MNEKLIVEYLKTKRDEIIKDSLVHGIDVGNKVYAIDMVIRIINAGSKAQDE